MEEHFIALLQNEIRYNYIFKTWLQLLLTTHFENSLKIRTFVKFVS